MSDDERKGDDKIDVKHLQEEIEMVKGWGVRHNIMIEDINDSIRSIRRRLDELETGNTGRRTGRSRRGNIQNRPAIPPRVGGRRTRRGRRKKRTRRRRKKSGGVGLERVVQLNEVKIGARYGVRVRLGNVGEYYFRGNLISVSRNTNPHLDRLVGEDMMYAFNKVQGDFDAPVVKLAERWIIEITEYDIPGLNDTDANKNVNQFLGGRRKKRTRRRRKKRRKSRRRKRSRKRRKSRRRRR